MVKKSFVILDIFEKIVEKYPNNIAVVAKNGSLTYAELSQKSEKIAAYLIEHGVKNDDLIGIFIDCSLEMIVAIIAVIKSGAAYVPMAHDAPLERVSYILEDSQAKFLLSLPHLVKDISTQSKIIDINNNFSSYIYKRPKVQELDLLYVIYTSGTTGRPKGTLLENKGVVNYVNFVIEHNNINSDTVGAKFVNIGFDASIIEIYPILLCGAKLCVLPEEERLSTESVNHFFIKNKVTFAFLPTQFAELFFYLENFTLENLLVGGDKLRQFIKKPYHIKNVYGPTEITVQSNHFLVDKDYDNIPIGKPLPNYTNYVVDQNMNLLPVGEVGELLIGGYGLARGYLNNPALTAEKFIANPFQTPEEKKENFNNRLYKSGDLVRQLPDGNLEYIGRNDFQVKIRGYRIETGEIEHLIQKIEEVKQTIVIPLKDSNNNSYLCAYYTSDKEIQEDFLIQTLNKNLADYMIPEYFVWLKEFPIDVNGKINRRILPKPDLTKFVNEYAAPSTPEEELICSVFSKILGIEKIGIHDNFYRIGGNSIKSIFAASQLKAHFDITVVDIFTHKTAFLIAKNIGAKNTKNTLIVQPKRDFYPLTFAQELLFAASQMDANTTLYNIPQRIEIHGQLDKEKLEKALDALVLRHSALRSQFAIKDNVIMQRIQDKFELKKTFTKASVGELESLFQEFITPFNLTKDPLIRIHLVKIDNNYHSLFFDIHHIVFDGGSQSSFLQDLVSLYNDQPLEPAPLQYVDFALWQRGEHGLAEINKNALYWQQLFCDHEFEALNLPLDFQRPQKPSYEGDSVMDKIEGDIFNKIVNISQSNQVSLYSLAIFALNTLFYIYTGQEKIVIGSFANGRTQPKVKDMVGEFVNTLPLLTIIKEDVSNLELIGSIQKTSLNVMSHQDYPIEFLMKDLKISVQEGINPFFNVALNFLEDDVSFIKKADLTWRLEPWYEKKIAKFDLGVILNSSKEGLSIEFNYATSLFKRDTIERMLGHFKSILNQLTIENMLHGTIKNFQILSPKEQHQLLVEFNDTKISYPKEKTILSLLEEAVLKYPHNIAVTANNGSLTYAELSQKSEKIAAYFIDNRVKNDDLIGIFIDSRLEMIVAIIAVIKAGAAYVPMAHDTPLDRVAYILDDCKAKFLLSLPHLVKDISTQSKIIDINADFSSYIYKRPKVQEHDLLYAIYTSGTTGRPKGTLLENKGVVNYVYYLIEDNKINSQTVGAKYVSFGFDPSVNEIYPILLSGGKLCIVPDDDRKDPHQVNQYLIKHNVQYAGLPTQFAELFFQLDNNILKNLLVGGDKLRQFIKKLYNIKNAYGPTETTVQSHVFLVDKNYDNIPIGKPLPNYTNYVVNKNLQLLPIGVVGELLIGGDGVARGYLNRPELTAEKFIPNPFQTPEEKVANYNSRLYKTGDLVRLLPDGNVEYLGRNDFQVKIRGYRIETGEIEHQLQQFPGITQTLVVPLLDEQGSQYLCAYYTSLQEFSFVEITQFLNHNLASYMIPEQFVWMPEFPLNTSGKVDRRALPKPNLTLLANNYIAPSTPEEELICSVFSKILGIEKIGIHDNFYRIGGNSIKSIFAASQLKAHFEITVVDIFTHKTAFLIAKNIGAKNTQNNLIVQPKRDFYPLTFAQELLFAASQMDTNTTLYNIPQRIEIHGQLDKEKLGKALDALVLRHSALRSQFAIKDNVIVQSIQDKFELKKTFTKASVAELESVFQEFITPFNLTKDPLIRIQLVKIDNNYHSLFFDIHHIVFDGGSLSPFLQDLVSLYNDQPLEQVSLQYVDFALWQRGEHGLAEINKNALYWQQLFCDHEFEALNLPLDFQRPQKPSYEGASVVDKIEGDFFNKLVNISQTNQVSLYSLAIFALNTLFYTYTGQEKIVIGTFANGRTQPEIKDMVGGFVNTLPLLTILKEDVSNLELIRSIQKTSLNLMGHQDYPINFLMKDLKISVQEGINPFFNVALNFFEDDASIIKNSDLTWQLVAGSEEKVAKFDLTVMLTSSKEGLSIDFNYATSLFKRNTIERMLGHFKSILNQLTQENMLYGTVKNFQILSPKEQQKLLFEFNDTKKDYTKDKTILSLFEEAVKKYPHHIAVTALNGSLTYTELSQKSEKIAAYLIENGVKNDDLIGIFIDCSLEMIVAITAVIKSGAAYVPMAHDTPLERVSYILEDSQAKFFLSLPHLMKNIFTQAEIIDINGDFSSYMYKRPKIKEYDLLYAIYTSGTTGRPKGTLTENKSVINYVNFLIEHNKINSNTVGGKFASIGFDASVIEIYPILLSGGQLCIVPYDDRKDLNKVNQYFISYNIQYAFLPTQFGELFFELGNPCLHNLLIGGDKLRQFINKNYNIKNVYGPTEITVQSHHFLVDKNYDNIPIGKPLPNYTNYVVNKNLQLLPIGVVGELLIGGDGVARGYLNRPELTAEKFIPNPFQTPDEKAANYNSRLYKTGDLVRLLPDGNVEYIGRNDFQVKIRGFRIETGEIEHQLQQFPGITQTLVVPLLDAQGSNYLCAYYTSLQEFTVIEITQFLNQNLASYMIPEQFVWMSEFPLNTSGKVDRRALPKPNLTLLANNYIAPSTPEEGLICSAFSHVLGLEQVGIHDNFYQLGGNSLKTIMLVSKLQTHFKVIVSDIFQHKTPSELAKNIVFAENNLRQKLENIKKMYKEIPTQPVASLMSSPPADKLFVFNQSLKPIQQILLTGATGYLGCNILYQLLTTTQYQIVTLIRASSLQEATKRLSLKFAYYFDMDLQIYKDRLSVYTADLEKTDLSLDKKTYQQLQENTDSIIHSAALVKHYGQREEFYNANVQSTVNLLEFCKQSRGKNFHYISTYSVLQDGFIPNEKVHISSEEDDGDSHKERSNIYVQTKYEGEVVTRNYRAQGLTTSIYRVGNLSMISFNGRNQENIEDNGFFTMVKGMLNLGVMANEVATMEISPVDITALSIVKLFCQKNLENKTHHVYHPQETNLLEILKQDSCLNLTTLEIENFIDYLIQNLNLETYRNYVERFMLHAGWLQESTGHSTQFILQQDRTISILNQLGLNWPNINLTYVQDILAKAFQERSNFLSSSFIGQGLSASNLLLLSKLSKLCHYESEQKLATQGDNLDNVKLIMEGYVDNYIKSTGGWLSSLQLISAGDVANFEALVNQPSTSSFEAIFGPVSTIEFSQNNLYELSLKLPDIYNKIFAKILADKDILQKMYGCLK